MSGWISIHRKIQSNWLWEDKPFSKGQAWIDLIMMMNHKDNKTLLGSELIEVKRGSRITSEVKLAERWGWSRTKVRGFLSLLEQDNMIEKKSDNRKTTLTVVNYSDYQLLETAERQQKNSRKTAKEQQKNTNNNDNNDNNDNKSTTRGWNKEDLGLIIDKWNQLNLQQLRSINPGTNRHSMLLARLKEYSLDEVVQAIESIGGSSFLKGQNKNGWTITFDWFIKPNNFIKVLEGNYVDKPQGQGVNIHKSKFHNFEGRTGEYSADELNSKVEDRAAIKRQEYLERLKKGG